MNTPQFEWHQLDDQQYTAWPPNPNHSPPAENATRTGRPRQERTLRTKFYELVAVITLVYGLVVLFIWQQANQRLVNLENEIALLQTQPSESVGQTNVVNSLADFERALQDPAIKPQWRALMEIIEAHLRLAYGQVLDGNLRQRLTQPAGDIQAYLLGLTVVPAGQARWREELAMHAPSYQLPNVQYAVANSLVEFILAEYGVVKLIALLDAFTRHEHWATLAPALFGLSVAELEAEWHRYLQKRDAVENAIHK
jgi:hypothetical protein